MIKFLFSNSYYTFMFTFFSRTEILICHVCLQSNYAIIFSSLGWLIYRLIKWLLLIFLLYKIGYISLLHFVLFLDSILFLFFYENKLFAFDYDWFSVTRHFYVGRRFLLKNSERVVLKKWWNNFSNTTAPPFWLACVLLNETVR